MPVLSAEELTYNQLRRFDRQRSIAFVSVSALEVHGPHLPLGMDMFSARWQAEETARRFAEAHPEWTVVVYPHLPVGTDELPLPGSIDGTQQTVYRTLLAHGASLARAGFGFAVVTNGHGGPRHAAALEAACRRVSRQGGIDMFSPSIAVLHGIVTGDRHPQLEHHLGRPLSPDEQSGLLHGEHAGTMETSFALAERPDQVDPMYRALGADGPPVFAPILAAGRLLAPLLDGEEPQRQQTAEALAGGVGWLLNLRFGYGGTHPVTYQGNPAASSAELGRAIRETMIEGCLDYVERVTTGELPAVAVRSIASGPAIIQPGFWRRIGVGLAIAGAVAVWGLGRRRRPMRGVSEQREACAGGVARAY